MSNKVKDTVIYISKRSSIIKLKSLIHEVTQYKSIDKEYTISSIIGKGGFGTVVKGTTIKTGIPVAIKILQKDYSKREIISMIRSVIDIIRYISSLNLDGVVKTIDIIDHFDTVCIVQEFAEGGSLADFVSKRMARYLIYLLRWSKERNITIRLMYGHWEWCAIS